MSASADDPDEPPTSGRARALRLGVVALVCSAAAGSIALAIEHRPTASFRVAPRESEPTPVRIRAQLAFISAHTLAVANLAEPGPRRSLATFVGSSSCPTRSATSIAPDASSVAYYASDGAHLVSVTGVDRAFDWQGVGAGCTVTWTPDSKRVAFVVGDSALVVMPGESAIPLAGATSLSFAPDSLQAVVSGTPNAAFGAPTGPGLHVLDLQEHTWRTVVSGVVSAALWGPVGEIAFARRLLGRSAAIWLVRTNGSALRELASAQLRDVPYAFTPDGTALVAFHDGGASPGRNRIDLIATATGRRQVVARGVVPLGIDHTGRRLLVGRPSGNRLVVSVVTIATHRTSRIAGLPPVDGASWTG